MKSFEALMRSNGEGHMSVMSTLLVHIYVSGESAMEHL